MRTERLYNDDPYLTEFRAEVIETLTYGDKYGIVLDRTAFYPAGGGQPWDTGYLNDEKVTEVIEKDGKLLHIVDNILLSTEVKGSVDWARRFDFMQQHTGQHILSACFEKLLNGSTDSFHMGKDIVSIEINIDSFSIDDAERIENMANDIIYSNLPVIARIVSGEELNSLPLRKMPKVTENIRIVEVKETDYSPCGGTHVRTTGEVGMIKIKNWEKCKGGIKFAFVCGNRALKDYGLYNSIIRALCEKLSARDSEIVEAVDKLLFDLRNTEKQLSASTQELIRIEADNTIKECPVVSGIRLISRVLDNRSINDVKLLAQYLTKVPGTVALLACKNENAQVIFSRSEDVNMDMNALFKAVLPIIDGKGGGNSRTAQGGGSRVDRLEEFMNNAKNLIISK
ncbi:MAG TPA: DHHA1 domain-containing protein [Bacillota bacterium]|nr:DHHA1 domain-containing protein [Bacillota bacterium]HPX70053.1 DHHA1 domain-containing protein [Bacillota bacterium]HQA64670.1 DHHA1 domain-containing protein [Bacillota bacterium]HQO43536.1 DHHA1 domain-containing protein [Bacillota bacterium]HQQ44518.1 DHHA1 domain-containing protein [Bacillota bacterium]